ncbi:MAG: PEP-CTERM sorting domain-containing protein [Verrucomicrobia bacterium]|nr:PEP-CTERM sorting domain-containing protein [Verrucomicrobiota bacterium]
MAKWILVVGVIVVGAAVQAETIYSTSAGDGYYHNELGTAGDYFDSSGTTISSYYYYDPYTGSSSVQQNTGYIQFSLAAFTTESTISSATLNLYLSAISIAGDSLTAGAINFLSNSSAADGNASQKLNGNVQVVQMKDQTIGWLNLDVTSLVQSSISNGYSYACFSFNYDTAGYFDNNSFSINSADAASNNPYLNVAAVPEPATVLLFGLGGFGAWLLRRNSQKVKEAGMDEV